MCHLTLCFESSIMNDGRTPKIPYRVGKTKNQIQNQMKISKMLAMLTLLAITTTLLFSCKQEKTQIEPEPTRNTVRQPPSLKYLPGHPDIPIYGIKRCEAPQPDPCRWGTCVGKLGICYIISWPPEDPSPVLSDGSSNITGVGVIDINHDVNGELVSLKFLTSTDTFTLSNYTDWSW